MSLPFRLLLLCPLLLHLAGRPLLAQQVMPRLLSQISKPSGVNQTTDSMVEDEKGNLWLATDNGVVRYDGQRFKVYHDPQLRQGDSYFHVISSPDGRIWCKPNGGNFLSCIDPKLDRIVRVPDTSALIRQYLAVVGYDYVFADAEGNLWIGQQGGLLKVNPRTFAVEPIIQEARQEVNWITQDRRGIIWLATIQGVYAYDDRSRQLTRYANDPQQPTTSLGQDKVFSVHARADGTVLVGLNNEVDVITPATRTVRRLLLPTTTRYGVVPVHEFYDDAQGNSYFRTLLGAYRYTARGQLQQLTFGSPTQSVQLIYPGRNRRWVDTEPALAQYDLSRPQPVSGLHLLDVIVNSNRLEGPNPDERLTRDTLGLPTLTIHDTDSLRLRFSPHADAQSSVFRYRLAGHDPAWHVTSGVDATASYQLPGGTYTFELNQRAPSGEWAGSATTLTLVVQRPFWKTGWFWVLVLAVAGGVGGGLLQSWNRRRHLRQELARRAFEAATLREMDEIKSRFFATSSTSSARP